MFKVGFLGRGRLGLAVLERLLADESISVPIILTCRASVEFGATEEDFAALAARHGIPFHVTNTVNKDKWVSILKKADMDIAISTSWFTIISEGAIATARRGFLNVHAGMLPRYRGNACLNWAILNGEAEVGITCHLMQPGRVDSGPVVLQKAIPVSAQTTVGGLLAEAERIGVELLIAAARQIRMGTTDLKEQNEAAALYCYPRLPRDGEIDWTRPAGEIERLVRAVGDPYPGAYSYFADERQGGRIRKLIVDAACVSKPPFGEFHAVPGHLIKLGDGAWGVVCGGETILKLNRVRIDGARIDPDDAFRSVRQRLGLDVQKHICDLEERVARLEQAPSGEIPQGRR